MQTNLDFIDNGLQLVRLMQRNIGLHGQTAGCLQNTHRLSILAGSQRIGPRNIGPRNLSVHRQLTNITQRTIFFSSTRSKLLIAFSYYWLPNVNHQKSISIIKWPLKWPGPWKRRSVPDCFNGPNLCDLLLPYPHPPANNDRSLYIYIILQSAVSSSK